MLVKEGCKKDGQLFIGHICSRFLTAAKQKSTAAILFLERCLHCSYLRNNSPNLNPMCQSLPSAIFCSARPYAYEYFPVSLLGRPDVGTRPARTKTMFSHLVSLCHSQEYLLRLCLKMHFQSEQRKVVKVEAKLRCKSSRHFERRHKAIFVPLKDRTRTDGHVCVFAPRRVVRHNPTECPTCTCHSSCSDISPPVQVCFPPSEGFAYQGTPVRRIVPGDSSE